MLSVAPAPVSLLVAALDESVEVVMLHLPLGGLRHKVVLLGHLVEELVGILVVLQRLYEIGQVFAFLLDLIQADCCFICCHII